jgi:hypothetical protein
MTTRIQILLPPLFTLLLLVGPAFGQNTRPDDVAEMRPTKLGLQITPQLARAATRNWVLDQLGYKAWFQDDSDGKVQVSDAQKDRLNDAAAERLLRGIDRDPEKVRTFCEGAIETILLSGENRRRLKGDDAKRLAGQTEPMLPLFRQFVDGFAEDARTILEPDQYAALEKNLGKVRRRMDRLDKKVERWKSGDIKEEGERLFEGLDDPEPEETKKDEELTEEEKQRREALRNARNTTKWQIRQLGPFEWAQFIYMAGYFFKFDDEQTKQAEQLLEDYRGRAEAVMTPEWKADVRRNRIYYNLRYHLDEHKEGPWVYHLDRDYDEMTRPITELGEEFRKAVIALATDEQRQAAVEQVREMLARHGMSYEDTDASILGLAAMD